MQPPASESSGLELPPCHNSSQDDRRPLRYYWFLRPKDPRPKRTLAMLFGILSTEWYLWSPRFFFEACAAANLDLNHWLVFTHVWAPFHQHDYDWIPDENGHLPNAWVVHCWDPRSEAMYQHRIVGVNEPYSLCFPYHCMIFKKKRKNKVRSQLP